jgi:hypothetical protein
MLQPGDDVGPSLVETANSAVGGAQFRCPFCVPTQSVDDDTVIVVFRDGDADTRM